jgi:hypothetical protein
LDNLLPELERFAPFGADQESRAQRTGQDLGRALHQGQNGRAVAELSRIIGRDVQADALLFVSNREKALATELRK